MKTPKNYKNWDIDDFASYCKSNVNSNSCFVWDEETEWLSPVKNLLDYIPTENWTVYFYGIWAGLKNYIIKANEL